LNFAFAQPYQHALFHESLLLEAPRWDYPSRLAALAPLTVADLQAFQKTLLGRLKVRVEVCSLFVFLALCVCFFVHRTQSHYLFFVFLSNWMFSLS
jgi:hypothetical protein